jgi:predicted anti-sigma-YlaC factor YlaD
MTGSEDCAQIADLIPEFLAGRVSGADDERVRAHLEGCAECRNRANAVSLLQQTPLPIPDPDRWDYFVKDVVEEAERRRLLTTPRHVWTIAAVLAAAAIAVFLWAQLAGMNGAGAPGMEGLAREVAQLPEEQAAEWTVGLTSSTFMPTGFDTSELSEEEIEQLVTEVGRT